MRVPRKLKKKIRRSDPRTAILIIMKIIVKYKLRWIRKYRPIPKPIPGGVVGNLEQGEPILTHEQTKGIIEGIAFKDLK